MLPCPGCEVEDAKGDLKDMLGPRGGVLSVRGAFHCDEIAGIALQGWGREKLGSIDVHGSGK